MEGTEITVITDHESFKSIRSKIEQPARILRFMYTTEDYDVRVLYRKCKDKVILRS